MAHKSKPRPPAPLTLNPSTASYPSDPWTRPWPLTFNRHLASNQPMRAVFGHKKIALCTDYAR